MGCNSTSVGTCGGQNSYMANVEVDNGLDFGRDYCLSGESKGFFYNQLMSNLNSPLDRIGSSGLSTPLALFTRSTNEADGSSTSFQEGFGRPHRWSHSRGLRFSPRVARLLLMVEKEEKEAGQR